MRQDDEKSNGHTAQYVVVSNQIQFNKDCHSGFHIRIDPFGLIAKLPFWKTNHIHKSEI